MIKKFNLPLNLVLWLLALLWLFPIFWLILTAFRAEPGQFVSYIFPKSYTWDNFKYLFADNPDFPFAKWLGNTFIVATASCLLNTFITVSMAYVMSRLRFKMKNNYLKIALVLNMFPAFMSMIAVYYILQAINMTQTLTGLVFIYTSTAALTFYIAKGFFDTIPLSLDESAMIDGATKAQIFTKITLPMSKPIIVYTSLMAFMTPWMDFIFARVIMGDRVEKYTVAIGLYSMINKETAQQMYTTFAAGCLVVAIPITILFLYLQKYYVEGITGGAVKG
ncbi:multiple sugar ABC transporter permease component [Listeria fleischmannii 1991]|uniref:Maltose transport system permease protein malG n=2 Tax=Listeria fleischmannii TaxID=1069827 RepID=A0A2X3HB26_9LIST|nr:multiple sugar ABC transporter permease component [Listeria fleischmannii 1991]SQC71766.1 Maltose transport system permease protein malG [Listeria fleischmannii subsp. fleischmannii]